MSKTETVPFLAVTLTTINPRTKQTQTQVVYGRFRDIEDARRYFFAVSEIIEEDDQTGTETRHKIVGVELEKGDAR